MKTKRYPLPRASTGDEEYFIHIVINLPRFAAVQISLTCVSLQNVEKITVRLQLKLIKIFQNCFETAGQLLNQRANIV